MGVINYGLNGVDPIRQGADWAVTVTVYTGTSTGSPRNLTGYTVSSKFRVHYDSTAVAATPTCTLSNATAGLIAMALSASQTSALTARRYVYDLLATSSSGSITRLTEGAAYVTPHVT